MRGAALWHCLRFGLGMDEGETQTTAAIAPDGILYGVPPFFSACYLRETIVRDSRFEVVESADSLNVLRRVA